jgi:hypothetical protein
MGEKRHVCTFPNCQKKFSDSSKLSNHIRTHTGEKPFVCEFPGCESRFSDPSALVRHKWTHSSNDEKPYRCEFPGCGLGFAQTGNLSKHFENHHTKEGQQRQKKKENHVMKYLDSVSIGYDREVHISYGCIDDTSRKFSRIDAVIDCPDRNLRILLEVDEDQHVGNPVSCELSRMTDSTACMRLGGETHKLLWLRFNPDAYQVNGETVRTLKKDRYKQLEHVIRTHVPLKDMEVMYMYYSTQDGVPIVMNDIDYSDSFKKFVV